ncbi:hypothetical protein CMQ_5814 [Grosmannia clavigera kw1407]|uniref:Uncharacterized protein n=1 Tax=Grosmannia clavigera (strain kw1407 / UAMH 11150) TaxID=655863 RepID=F0XIJ6_GROCL|nr:uncharacterized protein CMQ_5814 [Grosmannia clavigera kw1407]EFX02453.1 hypothetical protein CMQ_5814 [Grosmannia clavigera kw1407]
MPDNAYPPIVFYHYSYSPYARRIEWYLLLRGLSPDDLSKLQPLIMPRPDLGRLGVHYRRIPVLAIGRDIYVDTPLMLRKLEQLYPSAPRLGMSSSDNPEARAIEQLLELLTLDSGVLLKASKLIPEETSPLRDPAFLRDRMDFIGNSPMIFSGGGDRQAGGQSAEAAAAATALRRAEALVQLRHGAAILESTLLADGRDWILGTPKPSLADIDAVWPLHWLANIPGAFLHGGGDGEETPALSPVQFPRLFAWIERFSNTMLAARNALPQKPQVLDGRQAAAAVLAAPFAEDIAVATSVDAGDPVAQAAGLREGVRVVIQPTDTGMSGQDVGRLLKLTADEVVLELDPVESASNGQTVRLHAPRHNFVVRPWKEEDNGGAHL